MITYAFILMLPFWADVSCPDPIIEIVDEKGLTWTEEDEKVMVQATQGCIRLYGEDSCLVRFRKVGEHNYHAICRKFDTTE